MAPLNDVGPEPLGPEGPVLMVLAALLGLAARRTQSRSAPLFNKAAAPWAQPWVEWTRAACMMGKIDTVAAAGHERTGLTAE